MTFLRHAPSGPHFRLRPAPPPRRAEAPPRRWGMWVGLTLLWLAAALYAAYYLKRGWVPHDEGALAQSAERVLHGELPHRDFDDIYTGGLSLLHAGAFRVFGVTLVSLRLALFAAFVLWVPAVYYVALRFTHPAAAAAATLTAVACSIPAYSAAVPSWYNLFLATFGVAALLRELDTGERRWLGAAGVCAGLSCLMKVVGLYDVAAVGLYLLYREQSLSGNAADGLSPDRGPQWYSAFVGASVIALAAAVALLIRSRFDLVDGVTFVLPVWAMGGVVLARERRTDMPSPLRVATLLRLAFPYLAGVAAPIALFLIPYVRADSLGALAHGVLIAPARRLSFAAMPLPGRAALLAAVPVLSLLGALSLVSPRAGRARPVARRWRYVAGLLTAACTAAWLVVVTGVRPSAYRDTWFALRSLVPVAVTVAAWTLARAPVARRYHDPLFLVAAVCAFCALIQFPFSAPVYFLYVAPLGVLAALGAATALGGVDRVGPATLSACITAFMVFRVHPAFLGDMERAFRRDRQTEPLAIPRGGLRVEAADAAALRQVVALAAAHAGGGYTYAAPDAPEVYFLTGLRNPTRTLFDFFDEPMGKTERVLAALDAHHVRLVVVKSRPEFSPPLDARLAAELARRYPIDRTAGAYVVRWR